MKNKLAVVVEESGLIQETKVQELMRKAKVLGKRIEELSKYVSDVSLYKLANYIRDEARKL